MSSLTYMQLLRNNRSFRRLWVGQIISELGNWFNFIAGLGLVRAVSGADPSVTAIMIVVRLTPFAIVGPLAGAVVDRWSRRTVMLVSDLARMVIALGFLLVRGPEDLWIAYLCMGAGSLLGAPFEAARNAAMPNLTGEGGLLAGNSLMYSSRFLLSAVGMALGSAASARFGYGVAFVINSLSFAASAYSVWLVPEREMREESAEATRSEKLGVAAGVRQVWRDMGEGWTYIIRYPLVGALVAFNVLWAVGGGANTLIFDQLGGVLFAAHEGLKADTGFAVLSTAAGIGLFIGMLIARRVGAHIELHKLTVPFMGWTMIVYGVMMASIGLMPSLWWAGAVVLVSHLLVSAEFAIHITLLMSILPDNLRGRVTITDRAAEILVMSLSSFAAGWALHGIS
ncbi:MAG: MFS transporter, partial [Acidobacteria bacterium]|nr:MFS transporter [Acidobacteriota bacterium]